MAGTPLQVEDDNTTVTNPNRSYLIHGATDNKFFSNTENNTTEFKYTRPWWILRYGSFIVMDVAGRYNRDFPINVGLDYSDRKYTWY